MFVELAMMAIYGGAHSKGCIQSCWVLRRVLDLVVRGRDVDGIGEGSKGVCGCCRDNRSLSTCSVGNVTKSSLVLKCSLLLLLMYVFLQAVEKR